ncbi:MAG: hypothetical protein KC620_19610 [Myxococcales bacterium]|nr:hypothetical protein [Myxococcales bacterium]
MRFVTLNAVVRCPHQARVELTAQQSFVRIEGEPVLTAPDPEGRPVDDCPNVTQAKPCKTTLVIEEGYSPWIRIDGRAVMTDAAWGYTDGTPPGACKYTVRDPGQQRVGVDR